MAVDYSQVLIDGTTYTIAKILNRKGKPSFEKRFSCFACHEDFSRHEVQFYDGRPYGVPCGCFRDISQISSPNRR